MTVSRPYLSELISKENILLLGITDLNTEKYFSFYKQWLSENKHAQMQYLERNQELRKHPQHLLPQANKAIVVALPYYSNNNEPTQNPKIAMYAQFKDYHQLLKTKCGNIVTHLKKEFSFHYRITVDSAPLLEKILAVNTELGFYGKNTCYIHPQWGSFLLLGEILTDLDIPIDNKIEVSPYKRTELGGCGSCKECEIYCPTQALSNYTLDSNLCLSYWTIENKGPIPEKFWPYLSLYLFGCDICQLVCPYNKKEKAYLPSSIKKINLPSLLEIAIMDQKKYEHYFGGTPLTRAKRNGLRRNALIAMTVLNHPDLACALEYARIDNSYPIDITRQQIEKYLIEHSV